MCGPPAIHFHHRIEQHFVFLVEVTGNLKGHHHFGDRISLSALGDAGDFLRRQISHGKSDQTRTGNR